MKNEILINNEINAEKILLIFDDGNKKQLPLEKAINIAKKQNLDLVQISMQEIPICKLMNYSKYIYQLQKQEKENKKKQKQNIQETKEIRLSATIDTNDINIKAKQANKFLANNKKVKIALKLKGRENKELAIKVINTFLDNIITPYDKSQKLQFEGKFVTMFIIPIK